VVLSFHPDPYPRSLDFANVLQDSELAGSSYNKTKESPNTFLNPKRVGLLLKHHES
jgi:hypothetical protein